MNYYGYDVEWNPGIREMLLKRGVSSEVIDLIETIPDPQLRGKVVNFARGKPDATVDDIDKMLRDMPKQRPLSEGEISILQQAGHEFGCNTLSGDNVRIEDLDTSLGRWAALQIVKYGVLGFGGAVRGDWSPATWITKLREIRDWALAEDVELASYKLDRAVQASDEWHAAMAGEGSGEFYDNTGQVVYQWPDGWTIRTIVSENDVIAEGEKQSNCLRTNSDHYFGLVKTGKGALYSLRDPENKPAVSICFQNGALVEAKAFANKHIPNHLTPYIIEWLRVSKLPIRTVSEVLGHMDTLPDWVQPIDLTPDLWAGVRKKLNKWMDYEALEREKQRLVEAAMDRYESQMRMAMTQVGPKTEEMRLAEQQAWNEYETAMAELKEWEEAHSEKRMESQTEKKQYGRELSKKERNKIANLTWRIV